MRGGKTKDGGRRDHTKESQQNKGREGSVKAKKKRDGLQLCGVT